MDGPCRSGHFFLSALPKTNLYLLVIEDWSEYRQSYFYNFNCHISNRVFDAGAFRIVNGTCAHIETQTSLKKKEKCPALKNVHIKCSYNKATALTIPSPLQLLVATVIVISKWRWFLSGWIYRFFYEKLIYFLIFKSNERSILSWLLAFYFEFRMWIVLQKGWNTFVDIKKNNMFRNTNPKITFDISRQFPIVLPQINREDAIVL